MKIGKSKLKLKSYWYWRPLSTGAPQLNNMISSTDGSKMKNKNALLITLHASSPIALISKNVAMSGTSLAGAVQTIATKVLKPEYHPRRHDPIG
jgi:hypothetical protein